MWTLYKVTVSRELALGYLVKSYSKLKSYIKANQCEFVLLILSTLSTSVSEAFKGRMY